MHLPSIIGRGLLLGTTNEAQISDRFVWAAADVPMQAAISGVIGRSMAATWAIRRPRCRMPSVGEALTRRSVPFTDLPKVVPFTDLPRLFDMRLLGLALIYRHRSLAKQRTATSRIPS